MSQTKSFVNEINLVLIWDELPDCTCVVTGDVDLISSGRSPPSFQLSGGQKAVKYWGSVVWVVIGVVVEVERTA
jgi:hypothetical protein